MKGQIKDIGFGLKGDLSITLALPREHANNLIDLTGGDVSVEIKKWRERRSQSSNAYAWVLITKIAQSMTPPLNKQDVYIEMLKRYGQGGIVTIEKEKLDGVLRAFDYYEPEPKGQGRTNGREFWHMMVYVGSSKYDTKEMSVFVDGIVQEAKDLGIETLTPQELALLEGNHA